MTEPMDVLLERIDQGHYCEVAEHGKGPCPGCNDISSLRARLRREREAIAKAADAVELFLMDDEKSADWLEEHAIKPLRAILRGEGTT